MAESFQMEFAGRRLVFETGKLAGQANGAVLARYGDTAVLVTATMSKQPREGIDFFPLLVDYEERMYAIGRIPGGWGRREGRPPEGAILAARMIDRTLRPLFPEGFRNDVQVVATILSVDYDHSPDIAALLGRLGRSDHLRHPLRGARWRRPGGAGGRQAGPQPHQCPGRPE